MVKLEESIEQQAIRTEVINSIKGDVSLLFLWLYAALRKKWKKIKGIFTKNVYNC